MSVRLDGLSPKEVLITLAVDYYSTKRTSEAKGKTNCPKVAYAKGRFLGVCLAYEFKVYDGEDVLQISSIHNKKLILSIDKTMFNDTKFRVIS